MPEAFHLEELSTSGAGQAYFSAPGGCIVLKAGRAGPLLWSLKNRKIAEGAILTEDTSGYHLHLLEMKSKLTQGEWAKAILQFEGMHLAALAAIRLLGVSEVTSVTCYIAYKDDAMSASESADLILMKTFVGKPNPIGGVDSWTTESLELPLNGAAKIVKGQRDVNNNVDFGQIAA